MKIDNTKYFEDFNLFRDRLKGRSIERLLCCLIDGAQPADYSFEFIQGADFGYDFILDSGDTLHIRVSQIGFSFGLFFGLESISNKINDRPKLWDLTTENISKGIINKLIKDVEFNKVSNAAGQDFKDEIDFIDQIEILIDNESFIVLTAEYLPDKDKFYLEADEATIIVGNETIKKYKLK